MYSCMEATCQLCRSCEALHDCFAEKYAASPLLCFCTGLLFIAPEISGVSRCDQTSSDLSALARPFPSQCQSSVPMSVVHGGLSRLRPSTAEWRQLGGWAREVAPQSCGKATETSIGELRKDFGGQLKMRLAPRSPESRRPPVSSFSSFLIRPFRACGSGRPIG